MGGREGEPGQPKITPPTPLLSFQSELIRMRRFFGGRITFAYMYIEMVRGMEKTSGFNRP